MFEHRTAGKYGENLYYSYNSDPSVTAKASDACDSWYNEIKYFTFGREPLSTRAGMIFVCFFSSCGIFNSSDAVSGHFTQLIWKDTSEVGMGIARSRTGKQYIVANYNPPGNYIGRYAASVPRPL